MLDINELNKKWDYMSIIGPTATGKTDAAIRLAQYMPIEIISVDSVSVYKGLDIGSAKPSLEERHKVKHHLIDIVDLNGVYTVGRFVEDVEALICDIKARGKMPVLCGGTMMYMSAFLRGYQDLPRVPEEISQEVKDILERKGQDYLYNLLEKEDPAMAEKIHPNDKQRTQRALMVFRSSGQSLSDFWHSDGSKFKGMHFLFKIKDRDYHRSQLRKRVDHMFDIGFEKECEDILRQYGTEITKHPAMKSIGYKELSRAICEKSSTSSVREKIVVASAQFVKRQMTWLNAWGYKDSIVVEVEENNNHIEKFLKAVIATTES